MPILFNPLLIFRPYLTSELGLMPGTILLIDYCIENELNTTVLDKKHKLGVLFSEL